jgi:DNA-binding transcriptional ArsR family regulator
MKNVNSVFSALADETRRRIIVMLAKDRMSVNEIAGNFKISRPAISKHLRLLRQSRLVSQKKEGREVYYNFNPKPMKEVFNWLKFYDKFWDEKLNSLKRYVEDRE